MPINKPTYEELECACTAFKASEKVRASTVRDRDVYQRLFQTCMNAVLILNPCLEIEEANAGACQLLGWNEEEFKQNGLSHLAEDPDALKALILQSRRNATGHARGELCFRRKDGRSFEGECAVNTFPDGWGIPVTSLLVQDITARNHTEQALRESEQMFQTLFRDGQSVKLLIDPDTTQIVDANHAAVAFYGYPLGILKSMKISHINILSKEEIQEKIREATDKKYNFFEFKHQSADGNIRDVEVYSTPFIINHKKILFSIVHDITARKQAEKALIEKELQLQFALEGAREGFWDCDIPSGRVVYSNAWAEMLGYPLHEIPTDFPFWVESIHPDDRERVLAAVEQQLTGQTTLYETEHRIRMKSGAWKWVLARGRVVSRDEAGKPLRALGTHVDIDEQKKAQEKLIALNHALTETNATKDKLFSIIGHDLRGPLGSIKTLTDMMLATFEATPPAQSKQMLEALQKTASTTYDLLENLLYWSKSQRDEISFQAEPILLADLAGSCITLLDESAHNKQIQVENTIDHQIIVAGDRNMLLTIFRNLLSNAIKFTPVGQHIYLSATTAGGFATISVKDKGVGIAPENLAKVFSARHLSTYGTAGEKGSGLGLLLCKEFVERHGGTIWAESEPGQGSTFKFTLPLHYGLAIP